MRKLSHGEIQVFVTVSWIVVCGSSYRVTGICNHEEHFITFVKLVRVSRAVARPDPFPNSEVKRSTADDTPV